VIQIQERGKNNYKQQAHNSANVLLPFALHQQSAMVHIRTYGWPVRATNNRISCPSVPSKQSVPNSKKNNNKKQQR
jgi:hypothetical protein